MIAGMPGSGKTLLAMKYMIDSPVKGLFFSADSDAHTMMSRVVANRSGLTLDEVEQQYDVFGEEFFDKHLDGMAGKYFVWEPAPTLDDITLEILAFEEMWGEPPELVVVDNLMNVVGDGEGNDGERQTFKFLHHLARKSGAGVFLLHHTKEGSPGGRKPPDPAWPQARWAVQGMLNQLPEVILTVANDGYHKYRVACVKNRQGPADPTGNKHIELVVDLPRMTIYDTYAEFTMAGDRRLT